MSTLVVEVCKIRSIEPHPNAERLAIATIRGWKSCIRFDPETGQAEFAEGERVVYIPPDAVLPPELANAPDDPDTPGRLGVMNYLSKLPKDDEGNQPPGGRVKATRLRGQSSYGLVMKIDPAWGDDPDWEVGTNVADHFGITKWEPPPEAVDGDKAPGHPSFHKYTDIENIGNFPYLFPSGEEVIFTEKLHGKNSRVGLVLVTDDEGHEEWQWMAGSHSVPRKEIDTKGRTSDFWEVLTDNVKELLTHIKDDDSIRPGERKYGVLLFGEIFGSAVQDMAYGARNGERRFRAFDIAVNGMYLDFDVKQRLFKQFQVEQVPILFRGPFSLEVLEEYTSGPTTICDPSEAGKFKGREGVVITPVTERTSSVLNSRLILKSISADYLARRGGTDSH